MIFIDSWVFLELFTKGKKFQKAKKILEEIKRGKQAVISTMVLAEVKYRISKKYDKKKSDNVIHLILSFPNIRIIPIISEIAIFAADLRVKYYSKQKPVSFADMINLASAVMIGCKKLFSGDKDFENIEEIDTVVI